jgi:nucleoid DNA-binding protein
MLISYKGNRFKERKREGKHRFDQPNTYYDTIARRLAERLNIKPEEAKMLYEAVIDIIIDVLIEKGKLLLPGLFKLRVNSPDNRLVKGKPITITADEEFKKCLEDREYHKEVKLNRCYTFKQLFNRI